MEVEILAIGPDHFDDVDPFLCVFVALLVRALLDAEHVELALIPADHDVESEPALADMVGGDHFLRRNDRIENRRVDGTEYCDALGGGEQRRRPGDRFERRALIIGGPPVTLPPADWQQKIDTGLVRHQRQSFIVRPAPRPAFGNERHGAAGGAIGAEQADLQLVAAVHGAARLQ